MTNANDPANDPTSDAARDAPRAGATNSLHDVPGLAVGHATLLGEGRRTGTTVVLAAGDDLGEGAVGGVDVRGGGPGTRETDLLDPRNVVERVHAICLSGGSAFGLAAAQGRISPRAFAARGPRRRRRPRS